MIDVEMRRHEYEISTGQRLRFMVPFMPKEIFLGAFSMILLGLILGWAYADWVHRHYPLRAACTHCPKEVCQ